MAMLFALCVALYAIRVAHTGEFKYLFVTGNLILAWLPFVLALITQFLCAGARSGRPLAMMTAGLWLLFVPNATYVVTDLQHYRPAPSMPGWYDGAFLGTFVFTGMLCSVVSLYVMQSLAAELTHAAASWLLVAAVVPACAFGIYLGRVRRWHSWHVVTAPVPLLRDVVDVVRRPRVHGEAFAITAVFTPVLAATYAAFYSIAAGALA